MGMGRIEEELGSGNEGIEEELVNRMKGAAIW